MKLYDVVRSIVTQEDVSYRDVENTILFLIEADDLIKINTLKHLSDRILEIIAYNEAKV